MKITSIIKKIILDPGIGFTSASVFLFYNSTSKIGFYACIGAFFLSIIHLIFNDILSVYKITPKLTLRLIGVALAITAIDSLFEKNIIAAIAGFMFAIADVLIGENIFEENKNYSSRLNMIITRPDLYIVTGNFAACIMAGHPSLYLSPLLIISLIIALQNAYHKREEYYKHPKLYISATAFTSAIFAINNRIPLVAISQLIIFITYINIEIRLTPKFKSKILNFFMKKLQQY